MINLLELYPLGIFNLLDESSSIASSNDEKLLNLIVKNHKESKFLVIPKLSQNQFMIVHTTKDVTYTVLSYLYLIIFIMLYITYIYKHCYIDNWVYRQEQG